MVNGLLKKLGVGVLIGGLAVSGFGENVINAEKRKYSERLETYYNASMKPTCEKTQEDNLDFHLERSVPGDPRPWVGFVNYGIRNVSSVGRPRSAISERFLEEDKNNTHIYLIYNDGINVSVSGQRIKTCHKGSGKACSFMGVLNSETELYKRVVRVNEFLGIENLNKNPFEGIYGFISKTSGESGSYMGIMKRVARFGLEKAEGERVLRLRKKYPGYNIKKVSMYSIEDNASKYIITGRRLYLDIDRVKGKFNPSLFVEIPQIRFVQSWPQDLESNARGLVAEFSGVDFKKK